MISSRMTVSKAGLESAAPAAPPPRPAPPPPAPPYLAVLQAVLLLGGWDDFQGDGPLGLRLKGKSTQPYHLPDRTLHDVTSYFPDPETHVQK